MNFDDLMHNEDKKVNYKELSYIMVVLFAIIMAVLVTNLLIGKEDSMLIRIYFYFFFLGIQRWRSVTLIH